MGKFDFIAFYMDEFGVPAKYRTSWGFSFGKWTKEAKPCTCGESYCKGWIMKTPKEK